MSDRSQVALLMGGVAATVAVATAYVMIHESRRKAKKLRKAEASAAGPSGSEVLSADRLIEVLTESARAAYQLIEQVR